MPVRRCAFLTMDDTAGWSIDADLAFAPLAEIGWQAEWIPWRSAADWDAFDAVYLAATWDYPEDPDAFLRVLGEIERSRATLVNSEAVVRWNLAKTYLRDLEEHGVSIVPTRWYDGFYSADLSADSEAFGTETLIVKPVVSTNATDTFLLGPDDRLARHDELARVFANRPFMVQPFLSAVASEGEYSLFYMAPDFSHAIRKVPKTEDFRVQEEHGASIEPHPVTDELEAAGRAAMRAVPEALLYARCDFVRDSDGGLRLMELELIEPSLYLRCDEEAPARFARAFDRYLAEKGGTR